MAKSFGVKWIEAEIRGFITGADEGEKETVQKVDANGEPQFRPIPKLDEDGNQELDENGDPMWLEPEPIMVEVPKIEKEEVFYIVDIPPKVEATRIQRAATAINTVTQQLKLSVTTAITSSSMSFGMVSEHSRELADELSRLNEKHTTVDENGNVSVDRAKIRSEQRRIMDELQSLDYLNQDMVDQFRKREEYSRKAEKLLSENIDLVLGYIRDVRIRSGDVMGEQIKFHARRDQGAVLLPWTELSQVDRRAIAERKLNDMIPPVMAALAKGASLVVMEK